MEAIENVEKQAKTARNNGRLSLYPLKFEEAVKDLLKVKASMRIVLAKKGEK